VHFKNVIACDEGERFGLCHAEKFLLDIRFIPLVSGRFSYKIIVIISKAEGSTLTNTDGVLH